MNLRIIHCVSERVVDPEGKRERPWREYQLARNTVLEACVKHGSVGPMAACPIQSDLSDDEIDDIWEIGSRDAAFYLLDDQLNYERYLYMEITQPEAMTLPWLEDVVQGLLTMPGWGLCIKNIHNGYLIILPPVLLVMVTAVADCGNTSSVLDACRASLIV